MRPRRLVGADACTAVWFVRVGFFVDFSWQGDRCLCPFVLPYAVDADPIACGMPNGARLDRWLIRAAAETYAVADRFTTLTDYISAPPKEWDTWPQPTRNAFIRLNHIYDVISGEVLHIYFNPDHLKTLKFPLDRPVITSLSWDSNHATAFKGSDVKMQRLENYSEYFGYLRSNIKEGLQAFERLGVKVK